MTEHEKQHESLSKSDKSLDCTSTHIKRADIEPSQFGESDYPFARKLEH